MNGLSDAISDAEVECSLLANLSFFFFQAEDGIRDYKVTGVQTCALPICGDRRFLAGDLVLEERRAVERRQDGRLGVADAAMLAEQQHALALAVGQCRCLLDRKSGVEGKRGDLGGRRII